jgi:hypothetical protein
MIRGKESSSRRRGRQLAGAGQRERRSLDPQQEHGFVDIAVELRRYPRRLIRPTAAEPDHRRITHSQDDVKRIVGKRGNELRGKGARVLQSLGKRVRMVALSHTVLDVDVIDERLASSPIKHPGFTCGAS